MNISSAKYAEQNLNHEENITTFIVPSSVETEGSGEKNMDTTSETRKRLTKEQIEQFEKAGFKVCLGECPVCGAKISKDYLRVDDSEMCIGCFLYNEWF